MKKNCIPVAVLVAGAMLALSSPLRAQISTTVDEHGKLVFVNGDSPKARRGSTISSTQGSSTLGSSTPATSHRATAESTADTLGANDGYFSGSYGAPEASLTYTPDPSQSLLFVWLDPNSRTPGNPTTSIASGPQ